MKQRPKFSAIIVFIVYLAAIFGVQGIALADMSIPDAPTGLKATSDGTTVTISWNPSDALDLDGYNVYGRGKNDVGYIKLTGSPIKEESYIDYYVMQNVTYVYYVTTVDRSGNESSDSDTVEVTVQAAPKFSDVSSVSWYDTYVTELASGGIVAGYSDGTFKPNNHITRAEFSKMLCLAMNWTLNQQSKPTFIDVKSNSWAYAYVETGSAHTALTGYNDGTFKPNQNISREEIAKIIATTLSLSGGTSSYADIKTSWAKSMIDACVTAGIISGYTDNTFRPKNFVTRAEAAKIISSMIGR